MPTFLDKWPHPCGLVRSCVYARSLRNPTFQPVRRVENSRSDFPRVLGIDSVSVPALLRVDGRMFHVERHPAAAALGKMSLEIISPDRLT